MSTPTRRSRILAAVAALAVLLVAGALPVLAHAELVSSDPADGARLAIPPTTITLTFSEGVLAARSSFTLTQDGKTLGTGKAATDGDTTMTLDGLSLGGGDYVIQWTSVATDGDLLRGTVRFTVLEASAAPSTPASPAPSVVASNDASSTPAPTAAPATPSPQASADTAPVSSSGTDVLLPIVLGLLVVAGVGAFLLRRSRRA